MTKFKVWKCKNMKCPRYPRYNGRCVYSSNEEPANIPCATGSTPEEIQWYKWEWDGEYRE